MTAAKIYEFRRLNKGGRTYGEIGTQTGLSLLQVFALTCCLKSMKAARAARTWHRTLSKCGSAREMLSCARLHRWAE